MSIYFVAGFDLILDCKDERKLVYENEVVKCSSFFNNEIKVYPQKDSCDLIPYSINCANVNVGKNSKYEVFNLVNNDKLIYLKPFVYFNPLNLECKNLTVNRTNFLINKYRQDYGLIQIIFNSNCINFLTRNKNIDCEEFVNKIDSKELLFLKISQSNYGDYYYIFDQEKIVFEGKVKDVNIKDGKIIILKDDMTCYGQKLVCEYNVKDQKLEEYLVYYDNREVFKKIDIKYLFVDAIKIKNCELIKSCLSNELKDLPEENFWLFFGVFDDYFFIENNCILIYNNQITKVVKIETKNNMIVNIFD